MKARLDHEGDCDTHFCTRVRSPPSSSFSSRALWKCREKTAGRKSRNNGGRVREGLPSQIVQPPRQMSRNDEVKTSAAASEQASGGDRQAAITHDHRHAARPRAHSPRLLACFDCGRRGARAANRQFPRRNVSQISFVNSAFSRLSLTFTQLPQYKLALSEFRTCSLCC